MADVWQSILTLRASTVAGYIVDIHGDYNVAFPVAGGFIMLSGMMVFLLYAVRFCIRCCQYCIRHSILCAASGSRTCGPET